MNISVLGKLGPSVVTAGLVCACAADAQRKSTSAAPNPLILSGISVLPVLIFVLFNLARPAALSRPCGFGWQFLAGGFACSAATGYVPVLSDRSRPNSFGAHAMSVQGAISPAIPFTPPKRNSLTHIPGDEGWPIFGKTLSVLADPKGHVETNAAKYGLVYRSHLFGETILVLLGPEANELVMFDQAKLFSSALGWGRLLNLLF